MKIIGLSGSPRKKGNTAYLVEQALNEASQHGIETAMFHLSDYDIADCVGCEGCRKNYRCVVRDGMQDLYPVLLEADAIILGSPTYFYDMTAITKAFLDRLYCFEAFDDDDRSVWMSVNEALGSKLAAVISVCEQKRIEDTGHAAMSMRMTLQSLGYRVTDSVEIIDLFARGEALQDTNAALQVRDAGSRLAKTLLLRQKIRQNWYPSV